MQAPKGMTPVRGGRVGKIHWAIVRAPAMGGNGYVRVPKDHPWYGLDYNDINDPYPDVHGGLTYADGEWVGFDTAHGGDYWSEAEVERLGQPAGRTVKYYSFEAQYAEIHWTMELLIRETKRLARQANEVYKQSQA